MSIGAISPGRCLTRGGKEVYIACRCDVKPDGNKNDYPWWVEHGKRGWSVNDMGKHIQAGATELDIVSRVVANPITSHDTQAEQGGK